MNVPPLIGLALSSGRATMTELRTTLNVEALHDLLEVALIDRHNAIVADKMRQQREGGQ